MAKVIKQYNYTYFVIVVSQYNWEPYFSKELGEVLQSCGGLNIMEFTNFYSPFHGNKTTFNNWFD